CSGDRRGPRHVAEERDLAERVAPREVVRGVAVDLDAYATALDDEEPVAAVALAEHRLAGRNGQGDEPRGEVLQRRRRKGREDGDRVEELGTAGAGDGPFVDRTQARPRDHG